MRTNSITVFTRIIRGLMVLFILPVITISQTLPNIVIIYTDDLGWGDISVNNPEASYTTPRIDQMAAEGINFTDAHSSSTICTPSRYSLFTGQQIYRETGGGGGAIEGVGRRSYIDENTLTVGDMAREQGYRTGMFGKWHVGMTWVNSNGDRPSSPENIDFDRSTPVPDGPNERGFDKSFVTPNCPTTDDLYIFVEDGMVPQLPTVRHDRNDPDFRSDYVGKWHYDNNEGYMFEDYPFFEMDVVFWQKTMEFIKNHHATSPEQPFLAVFSTQIAHAPVLPGAEFQGLTGDEGGPRGDFLVELDMLVGRVLDGLDTLGIGDNTLVMFHSDNGPEIEHWVWMLEDYGHDATGPYYGIKRDGWEGGHRVPFIARWPAAIPAGQTSKQLMNTTDIFGTIASIIGYDLPDNQAVDAYDLLPAMLGTRSDDEMIRPYLLTQSFGGQFQVRQGDWKYLDHKGSGGLGVDEWQTHRLLSNHDQPLSVPEADGQLYHLGNDVMESTNLYNSESEKRQELQDILAQTKSEGRSAPTGRQAIGIENIPLAVNQPKGKQDFTPGLNPFHYNSDLYNLQGKKIGVEANRSGIYLTRNKGKKLFLNR